MVNQNTSGNQPNILARMARGAKDVGNLVMWHLVDGPKAEVAMRERADAEAIFALSHGFPRSERSEMNAYTGEVREFDRQGAEVHPGTDISIAVQPPFNIPPRHEQHK